MGVVLETETLEYWVDRAGGRAGGRACGRAGGRAAVGRAGQVFNRPLVNAFLQRGLLNIECSLGDGVCGVLGAFLDMEAVEQWVLSWRWKLLSTGWIGRAAGGGRAVAAGSVEYWVLFWRRGLWSTGCSPLETEAVEQWVGLAVARAGGRRSGGRSSGGRAGGSGF